VAEIDGARAVGRGTHRWLAALRTYLAVLLVANLAWEFAHMPLYTIWREGTAGEIAFAAIHCTGGDLLIGVSALMVALVLTGKSEWPASGFGRVAAIVLAVGVGYTMFSEWLNIVVRRSWAYSELMPVIPFLGFHAGLSPLLQWLVVPAAALLLARRHALRQDGPA
jgi:hypothetical protein